MGHLRLWKLPRTRKWQQVIALLQVPESTVAVIAASSIEALLPGLKRVAADPALVHAFWLLCRIPLAARGESFAASLRKLGLDVADNPTTLDVASALGESIDRSRGHGKWESDVGEIARLSAIDTVSSLATLTSGTLFTHTEQDTRNAFKPLGTQRNFGFVARDFFARFMVRYLKYYIGRETPLHVGFGQKFRNAREHSEFNEALDLHCRQAARIVQTFAGSWLGKTEFEAGITHEKVANFVPVALKKLREELEEGARS